MIVKEFLDSMREFPSEEVQVVVKPPQERNEGITTATQIFVI